MPKTDHRKNLTPTLITGLKKARKGERYQVMDAQVPGFGVRVTDKGHRTFILRTRYPGSSTPSRREIGNCVDITLTAAREKARKWRSLVAQGIDPAVEEEITAAERSIVRRAATLTVELERMEGAFASAGEATPEALDLYSRTAGNLRRLLESVGLQRRAKDITPDLRDYVSARSAEAE